MEEVGAQTVGLRSEVFIIGEPYYRHIGLDIADGDNAFHTAGVVVGYERQIVRFAPQTAYQRIVIREQGVVMEFALIFRYLLQMGLEGLKLFFRSVETNSHRKFLRLLGEIFVS